MAKSTSVSLSKPEYTYLDHSTRLSASVSGPSFRIDKEGSESDLVSSFLRSFSVHVPAGCRLTIFREPRLESGFPDLVAVIWDPRVAEHWLPCRKQLSKFDIRVMHFLVSLGPVKLKRLQDTFGSSMAATLERLKSAKMVNLRNDICTARGLKRMFAVKEIIAVEAKISKWQKALRQASVNRWFASLSCVLFPKIPSNLRIFDNARHFGLGVWVLSAKLAQPIAPRREKLPGSYASWLFNEWVWRIHRKET